MPLLLMSCIRSLLHKCIDMKDKLNKIACSIMPGVNKFISMYTKLYRKLFVINGIKVFCC